MKGVVGPDAELARPL